MKKSQKVKIMLNSVHIDKNGPKLQQNKNMHYFEYEKHIATVIPLQIHLLDIRCNKSSKNTHQHGSRLG